VTVFAQTLAERVRAAHVAARLARRLGEDELAHAHEADITDLLLLAEEQGIALPAFSAWP
jgi:hypothetical protein